MFSEVSTFLGEAAGRAQQSTSWHGQHVVGEILHLIVDRNQRKGDVGAELVLFFFPFYLCPQPIG
jgi:hypothetical protein